MVEPIRSVKLHFRDRRGAASHRFSYRADIAVLACEPGALSVSGIV